MRHTYECPLRWADMDLLGHVNNVTYVDYLQEARGDMFAAHAPFAAGGGLADGLAQGVVVVGHEVDFVAPLVFRREPVPIDCWVTDVRAASTTVAYEMYDVDEDGQRRVYLRASTQLAPYDFGNGRPRRIHDSEREMLQRLQEPGTPRPRLETTAAPAPGTGHVWDVRVRWSDVDAYRHVNNVKYVEYFQEARVRYLMDLGMTMDGWGPHVVARTDVDYRRQARFRLEPYQVHSWIGRVGERSFVYCGEVRDDGEVIASARVVMVCFDGERGSRPMAPEQRARLRTELGDGPTG